MQDQTKTKHVNYLTSLKQSILAWSLLYVAVIQCLNYSGQESKNNNLQFVSDTPVTLKQYQDQQTCYESVNPKQGHVQTERLHLNSIQEETPMLVFFVKSGKSITSLEYMRK